MIAFTSVIVFVASFQIIWAQPRSPPPFPPNFPPECRGPIRGIDKPLECCKIPDIFTAEEFEKCGFKKEDDPALRQSPPDCEKSACLVSKFNILRDGKVDPEGFNAFLDKFAEDNPPFKPTVEIAKQKCIGWEFPFPTDACEINKLMFCTRSTLFNECPQWEETEDCQKVKSHLDVCKKYFYNPKA